MPGLDDLSYEVDLLGGLALLGGLVVFAHGAREARRRQARMVGAWIAEVTRDAVAGPVRNAWSDVVVDNASPHPVYRVEAWPLRVRGDVVSVDVLPGSVRHTARTDRDAVPGGEPYSADLLLVFTDAAGRRWQRDCRTGQLRRARWWLRTRRGEPRAVLRAWSDAPVSVGDEADASAA